MPVNSSLKWIVLIIHTVAVFFAFVLCSSTYAVSSTQFPLLLFFNISLLFLFQYRCHISGPLCFQPLHHLCSDATCVRLSSMLPRHPRYLYHCLFIWCVFFSWVSHEIMRNYLFFFLSSYFHCFAQYLSNSGCSVHIWWMHT